VSNVHRGFTLLELVVAVAIVGAMLAVALPSFSQMRRHAQVRTTNHLLTASLASARVAAISFNVPVGVCAADARPICRTDGVWDEGWLVFRDPKRLGHPESIGSVITHVGPEQTAGGPRVRSSRHRSSIRFLPDGRSSGSNLSVQVCPLDPGVRGISVIVSNGGRVRSEPQSALRPECPPQT
jgi:type IV fimbrial biogenesis protein FimT